METITVRCRKCDRVILTRDVARESQIVLRECRDYAHTEHRALADTCTPTQDAPAS